MDFQRETTCQAFYSHFAGYKSVNISLYTLAAFLVSVTLCFNELAFKLGMRKFFWFILHIDSKAHICSLLDLFCIGP